jgi:ABC-2 type transport system ATP-binding protein
MKNSRGESRSDPLVSVTDLRKEYDGDSGRIVALDDVSFEVGSGSIVGLLGHNGAGKTTLIKMMLGLIVPTSGNLHVAGHDVVDLSTEMFGRVAAVLEGARTTYWRLTVRENIRFFSRLAGYDPDEWTERHDELLEAFDIADRADTVVNELSRGMKQKASIVTVLAQRPDLLFLDEPTLGLDVESSAELRRQLTRLVDSGEMTVIVSSHDMDVIEDVCDRVIILDDGQIVADESVADLMELFDRQTVAVTVDDAPAGLQSRIESEFELAEYRDSTDCVQIEVSVPNTDRLNDLTELLAVAGVTVRHIETTQVDFTDVYLELTTDDGEGEHSDRTEEVVDA